MVSEIDTSIAGRAKKVVQSITIVGPFAFPLQQIILPDIDVFASPNTYLQVIDAGGAVRTSSRNLGRQAFPLGISTMEKASKGKAFYETVYSGEQKLRIYNLPLILEGKFIGVLQVGQSLVAIETPLSRLRFILFIGSGLTVILAGTLGWLLARAALQPIDEITKTASAIQEAHDLNRLIKYDGPRDELGRLADTINDMFSRLNFAYQKLEQSYRSQKRFVADASHELRTPLTIIRGNVEFLQEVGDAEPEMSKEALEDISDESRRMSWLVEDLLSLARADAGQKMVKEVVSLRELLAGVVHRAEKLAGAVNFKVENFLGDEDRYVYGNEEYLAKLILIILDNAFKYTQTGGSVVFTTEVVNDTANITIIDNGVGIAVENIEQIFERFYRVDPSRGSKGTGLGLSIARWIAEEHKGKIEVKSTLGEGSEFIIRLPLCE